MRAARLLGLVLAAPLLATLAGPGAGTEPCVSPPGFAARERLESAGIVVSPAIELGRHFAVEAVVCDRGAGGALVGLRVDARMPEHRHGMNYRPRVSAAGAGRWVAEGLIFHMPGRWQLLFTWSASPRIVGITTPRMRA